MNVHLCGSVGLDSVDEVFATVGALLKDNVDRVPDGEPGGRRLWIGWQAAVLRSSPFLASEARAPQLHVRAGFEAAVRFGELGYAREARASYEDFTRARAAGVLASGTRFQVSLPTPYAVVSSYITPDDLPVVEPAYEAAMLREVERICAAVPHADLCIQWDVCTEMLMLDGQSPRFRPAPDMPSFISERFARLGAAVPTGVELGFHLCYGDYEGKHFVEPVDMTKLVEMNNLLQSVVRRPIAYVHMPVPIARNDDAYFAPLARLTRTQDTELYLGLVHLGDGVAGANERIAAAERVVRNFGVAAECGLGHWADPKTVLQILELHGALAQTK